MGPDDLSIYIGSTISGSEIAAAIECGEIRVIETTAAGIVALEDRTDIRCVVTDHNPPAVDCFELLEAVDERIPVILAPTNGSSQLATRALMAGAETYLDPSTVENGPKAIATAIDQLDSNYLSQSQTVEQRIEEFSSLVSHELRNPIQKATSGIALAKTQCDSEYLDEVESTLSRMDSLVENLLELLDEDDSQIELEPVDLNAAIEEAWPDASNATLSVETPLPTVEAEPSRLYQLVENLFRNCIDHGGETVTVRVGTLTASDTDDPIGFYVADDGPGIETEHHKQVFEYGYTTSSEGTGLGLAIVSEIAATFDWELTLTESAAGGTRIEISQLNII